MQTDKQKWNKELAKKQVNIKSIENHIMPRRQEMEQMYVSASDALNNLEREMGADLCDLAEYEKWLKEE